MSAAPLHIVFTLSACVDLREALGRAGRFDDVIGLDDDFSHGPIESGDIRPRLEFWSDVLGYEHHDDIRALDESFWQKSLDSQRPRIVWLSQWSTKEYCGFLEWLQRNQGASFLLADVTDVSLPDPRNSSKMLPAHCVSLIYTAQFVMAELWAEAKSPHPDKLKAWDTLWQKLRSEDAPLRVLTPEGLVSAPLDYFDADLLKHVGAEWIRAAHIVGNVLAAMMFDSFRAAGVFQAGDMLLFSRVRALVERGVLKKKGDLFGSSFSVKRA